jgi:L-fuconolactonase
MNIDAHQHFWKFDPVRDNWINDDMQVIRRDFLPADLQPVLEENGLDGCVAVQADQSEEENEFLLQQAASHPFIKAVIGWVDLRSENVEERLEFFRGFPKMKGFRHILQGEADRALMLQPSFKRGISLLGKYNYTYDILIYPDQLAYAKAFVSSFPNQQFIIDHLAKPYIRDKKIEQWKKDISVLGQYENVYCKVSGMVTEADWKNWKMDDFKECLDTIVKTFGMKRLVYGSDWPVCLVAATYEKMLGIVKNYFSSFSADEKKQFFGENARIFYHLN